MLLLKIVLVQTVLKFWFLSVYCIYPVSHYKQKTPEQVCMNTKRNNKECNCDNECIYFNDCCSKIVEPINDPIYKRLAKPSCVESITYSEEYPVYVWDRCPADYQNPLIKQFCETSSSDIVFHVPVYYAGGGEDSQYLLFRNLYCGLCNGFEEKDLQKPTNNISIKCWRDKKLPSDEYVPQFIQEKKCYVMGVIDENNRMVRRKCIRNLIQSCPSNASAYLAQQCSQGPAYHHGCMDDKNYRNKDCVKCAKTGHCIMTEVQLLRTNSLFEGYVYNYDIILNFKKYILTPPPPTTSASSINFNFTSNITFNFSAVNATVAPFTLESVGSLLTMLCNIISIVSLIVLIVMYLVAKDLRNLNGNMIVILSFTLLFALIALSTARALEFNLIACKSIAIFIHYSQLSSFTWMALYAFELLRTFKLQSMTNTSNNKLRKLFIYYCLAGFLFPALVCGVAALIDFLITPENGEFMKEIAPKYGARFCYINTKWGKFAWIFLPVLIFIMFNTVICGFLLYFFVQSYKRVSQAIRSKKSLFFICLKITAILGVSWGFYIITIFIGNDVLSIIGTLLNNLQGFFIMLCFLLNKKVIKTVKTSLSRSSTTTRSSGRLTAGRNTSTQGTKKERKPLRRDESSSKANSSTYNTRSTTV